MGFLLKIILFGVAVYAAWKTFHRWKGMWDKFVGPPDQPARPAPPPPSPAEPVATRRGARSFHTATPLRALRPKPWYAAYVQPSRRPKDGRYGDNPMRLQHYNQFQA